MKTVLILMLFYFVLASANKITIPLDTACHKYNKLEPAQEPSLFPRCTVVGDVFYLDGAIDSQMTYEIKTNYPNIKKIELNSFGGNVKEAYGLAQIIRQREITTHVRKSSEWFEVWVNSRSGITREAWREYLQRFIFETKEETQTLFQTYILYGMKPQFIDVIMSLPEDPDYFRSGNMDRVSNLIIGVKELVQYGIVTEIHE